MSTAVMPNIFTETVKPLVRAAKDNGATLDNLSAAFLEAVSGVYGYDGAKHATAQVGFTRLLASEGGSVSAKEAAGFYGGRSPTSEEAVRKAARLGQIIAVKDGRGGVHFPRWQFTSKGGVLPGLREVLAALRSHPLAGKDDLLPVNFLLNPSARLEGQRPLDMLRSGDVAALKRILTLAAEAAE